MIGTIISMAGALQLASWFMALLDMLEGGRKS